MDPPKQGGRAIKRKVFKLLRSQDFDKALKDIDRLPAHRVINPLFSFLYNKDEAIKWAAVVAMGSIVGKVADENMEAARVVMRRLMWNLNDESGGIGWGSPEAMGEIMAVHEGLAKEYVHILISYSREDGNYLEYEGLHRGLLWGIGRLAQERPELLKGAVIHLLPYMHSPDAGVRGLAAWIMGLLKAEEACSELEALTEDDAELQMTLDRRPVVRRVKELAQEALRKLPAKGSD
jgi:HEAT repeat protein